MFSFFNLIIFNQEEGLKNMNIEMILDLILRLIINNLEKKLLIKTPNTNILLKPKKIHSQLLIF